MRPQLARWAGRTGAAGALLSTMGCAACFPALAGIGAAVGLGFLAQWERVFVHLLIPAFAGLTLLAHAWAWRAHRRWQRGFWGVLGPLMVLAGWWGFLYRVMPRGAARGVLYAGLAVMLAASLWDLLRPVLRGAGGACGLPPKRL
jgi:mercuric ion transport protein